MNALAELLGGHPLWVYLLAFFPLVSLAFAGLLWLIELLEWLGLKKNTRGPTCPKQAAQFFGIAIGLIVPYMIVVLVVSKACQR